VHGPEHTAIGQARGRRPGIRGNLHPGRHRHGANPAVADAADRTPRDWARNERILAALGTDAEPPPRAKGRPAKTAGKGRWRRPTGR
jgi:hypothetical protein